MSRLRVPKDIWTFDLKDEDVQAGINYGIISHAWTYDRMNAQISGNLPKAIFRIAGGVAVQHAIKRVIFEKFGVKFERDFHDYKEEDYWDMRTRNGKIIDVKSYHRFTDYDGDIRTPLSAGAIVNSSTGENWKTFFRC